jgi:myo-inositol 2-dehydrogenase/D-chiro-inositol 1-dehydrogenase
VLIEPALNEFNDIDTAVVTLKFANGAVGVVDNSRQAVYGYDQRLEVFCENGTAEAGNEAENTTFKATPGGYSSARLKHFFMQRFASCYVDEVRQFVACVREDKPTPITAHGRRRWCWEAQLGSPSKIARCVYPIDAGDFADHKDIN